MFTFPQVSPPKPYLYFSPPPHVSRAPPMSFSIIFITGLMFSEEEKSRIVHRAFSSSPLLPCPSWAQMSSSCRHALPTNLCSSHHCPHQCNTM